MHKKHDSLQKFIMIFNEKTISFYIIMYKSLNNNVKL